MIEAGIAMPIVILAAVLLIRIFTFYIEILTTSVEEHIEALDRMDLYDGKAFKTYETYKEIHMIKGGLLSSNLTKTLYIRGYFINEDFLTRGKEAINRE
ncbi:MAG TPA: hypothetical protein GX736_06670 [Mogibacterium sp.]|nr:hypothetical protein [Mogibacterium sp.]